MEAEKVYPAPQALHEDVIRNKTVFMDTLRHFHLTLGTRFTNPVLGGKALDLHLLYVEVTRRGGFEKVVKEKKWREVIRVLDIPPTATSAAYALRKYYMSLLHHYEQVYFFRLQGKLVAPAVPVPEHTPTPLRIPGMARAAEAAPDSVRLHLEQQQQQMLCQKRKAVLASETPPALLYAPVVGIIEGKFDRGYFVSVTVDSKILRGVLYHISPLEIASTSLANNAIIPSKTPQHGIVLLNTQRRRKRMSKCDPTYPKLHRSGYNFFFIEKHSMLKILCPERAKEFTKMIGEAWSKLTQEERMIYENQGLKDRERYARELQEYQEKMMLVQPKEHIEVGPSTRIELKN